jgi:hypothetical protein
MDSLDLDISWTEKHERLLNIHQHYQKEHMDSIKICYIYVNLQSEIEQVICEYETLPQLENKSIISKERVLQLVQNKKILNNIKYSIDSILLYNVSIEPENIQKYVNSDIVEPFLKVYPIVDEILIHPSIFIFHEINCIYFLFKQHEIKPLPKSILKTSIIMDSKTTNKKTKRVRIQDESNVKKPYHNITKKHLPI